MASIDIASTYPRPAAAAFVTRVREFARAEWFWLVPAVLLFAWLSFLAFVIPYDYDEAVYTVVARGIAGGHWPYRDLFDHKPPLIYIWYLPGGFTHSVRVQRVFGSLLCALSVGAISVAARRWMPPQQWIATTWAYAAILANPFVGTSQSIESFMLLPLAGMVAVPSPFLAGALLAVAFWTKPTALILSPVLVLLWRRRVWRSGAGFLLVS